MHHPITRKPTATGSKVYPCPNQATPKLYGKLQFISSRDTCITPLNTVTLKRICLTLYGQVRYIVLKKSDSSAPLTDSFTSIVQTRSTYIKFWMVSDSVRNFIFSLIKKHNGKGINPPENRVQGNGDDIAARLKGSAEPAACLTAHTCARR